MKPFFQDWLHELETDGLSLASEPGAGATPNLWSLSFPTDERVSVAELSEFVVKAVDVRRRLAISQPVKPVTFYAWHDEMAGQFRFSTACCTPNSLPFQADVEVIDGLAPIVEEFLSSAYRDGIPFSELRDANDSDKLVDSIENFRLKVWTAELV